MFFQNKPHTQGTFFLSFGERNCTHILDSRCLPTLPFFQAPGETHVRRHSTGVSSNLCKTTAFASTKISWGGNTTRITRIIFSCENHKIGKETDKSWWYIDKNICVTIRIFYEALTSSIMKVHSLSSNSWDLGSLNKVTETSLFSGTAHTTTPLSGSFIVGSHGKGWVGTLRLFRHHTTLTLFGVLKENKRVTDRYENETIEWQLYAWGDHCLYTIRTRSWINYRITCYRP